MPGGTTRSDLVDYSEDHVFRCHAKWQIALDIDAEILRFILLQALRGKHVLDLARADPECQGAERSVRRSMRIAADDRHSRLRQALFGAENVDNSLLDAVEIVKPNPKFGTVFPQRFDLFGGDRIIERKVPVYGRDRVIERGEGQFRAANGTSCKPQALRRPGATSPHGSDADRCK